MNNLYKWDTRFLRLAAHVSEWSKDPSTQVGAVICDNQNRVVSLGYNGFPRGINDDDRLLDRETKLEYIVHAEINAILLANKSLENCTLYTYPLFPCSRCCSQIIQTGIKKIISVQNNSERWKKSIELSMNMAKEADIECFIYDKIQHGVQHPVNRI